MNLQQNNTKKEKEERCTVREQGKHRNTENKKQRSIM
jgi:hypothetical protein